jgi:hypothetical protein
MPHRYARRLVQTVQRQPDRLHDQTATWSLKLLQRTLRRAGWPSIGATTIGRILHEEGFSLQRDRTWCQTGTAYRLRKDGVYRVQDPQTQEKNRQGKRCVGAAAAQRASSEARNC